jgi:hypothetical protein
MSRLAKVQYEPILVTKVRHVESAWYDRRQAAAVLGVKESKLAEHLNEIGDEAGGAVLHFVGPGNSMAAKGIYFFDPQVIDRLPSNRIGKNSWAGPGNIFKGWEISAPIGVTEQQFVEELYKIGYVATKKPRNTARRSSPRAPKQPRAVPMFPDMEQFVEVS